MAGIITQGARDFGNIQYVAAYKVAHSNDGLRWTEYKDPGAEGGKVSVSRLPLATPRCPPSRASGALRGGRPASGRGGPF